MSETWASREFRGEDDRGPEWFLIWSNEHHMWWRDNESGYTQHIDEAGRYTRADAERIVAKATVDGELFTRREDPRNGRKYREFSEVVVAAPETLGGEL